MLEDLLQILQLSGYPSHWNYS